MNYPHKNARLLAGISYTLSAYIEINMQEKSMREENASKIQTSLFVSGALCGSTGSACLSVVSLLAGRNGVCGRHAE